MFNIFKTKKPMPALEDDITIAGQINKETDKLMNKTNRKITFDATKLVLNVSNFISECSSIAFELKPCIKFLITLQDIYKSETKNIDIDMVKLFNQKLEELISLKVETKIVTLLKARNFFKEEKSILILTDEYHILLIQILDALLVFKNDKNIKYSTIDLTNIDTAVQNLIMETQYITFSRKEWKLKS